jgi:hypothetical protein
MKKIYISGLVILASVSAIFGQTAPTCSLNPTFIASTKIGVYPDSATAFINGTVGVPYVQNITVKVPKDTVVTLPFKLCFNRFELKSPVGITNFNLPPGLNFTVTPSLMSGSVIFFPGNANNCASIWGTPTVAGTYTLSLEVQAFANGPSTSCPTTPVPSGGSSVSTQLLNYYKIVISPPVGVQEIGKDKFGVMQNQPNPFIGKTDIKFYVEGEDEAILTVYNSLGAIVNKQVMKTQLGENAFILSSNGLAAGVYIYSVKYKNAVSTKRLIISE